MNNELQTVLNTVPDYRLEWGAIPGEPESVRADYIDESGPLFGVTGGGVSRTGAAWQAWLEDDYLKRHCCGAFASGDEARAAVEAALIETAVFQNREGVR